jgi:hypothetical protein
MHIMKFPWSCFCFWGTSVSPKLHLLRPFCR